MVEISLSGSGEGPGWQRPGLLYSVGSSIRTVSGENEAGELRVEAIA